jgi:hypothetical protein
MTFALSLGASLAYVSLRNNDPVRIVGISDATARLHVASPFFRHRQALPRVRDFLLQVRAQSKTVLADGIAAALREQRTPGVAIVLSDFLMSPDVCEAALGELVARRFTVAAVRVIGPGESDPIRLFRRGHLVDAETGRQRFITLGRDNLARYQAALKEHVEHLQTFCNRCGIVFVVADTTMGVEQVLFHDLPALGLVH